MRRENAALRKLREPPGRLTLDVDRASKNRLKKVNAALKKQGVETSRLRDLAQAAGDQLNEVLGGRQGNMRPGFNLANNLAQ
jgi:hypothetical protein